MISKKQAAKIRAFALQTGRMNPYRDMTPENFQECVSAIKFNYLVRIPFENWPIVGGKRHAKEEIKPILCDLKYLYGRGENRIRILPFFKSAYHPLGMSGRPDQYHIYRILLKVPQHIEPERLRRHISRMCSKNRLIKEVSSCSDYRPAGGLWFQHDPNLWRRSITDLTKLILDDTQQATPRNLSRFYDFDNTSF